jgi:hypothetical protein
MKAMREQRAAQVMPRGRVAKWSKEQLDKLSTLELRALLANAERLNEPEVAALCNEILDARPRGQAPVRQQRLPGQARRLVSRGKAFELHGISPRSRTWSLGGIRTDGAVVLTVRAADVQKAASGSSCLLWGPNVDDSRPWSDTPGGKERLEHCRIALERGAAEGLLAYTKRAAGTAPEAKPAAGTDRLDPKTILNLHIEKRGEEYWGTWTQQGGVVNTFE